MDIFKNIPVETLAELSEEDKVNIEKFANGNLLQSLVYNEETDCWDMKRVTNIKRIRRITGYFSEITNWNKAKIAELHDRQPHFLS